MLNLFLSIEGEVVIGKQLAENMGQCHVKVEDVFLLFRRKTTGKLVGCIVSHSSNALKVLLILVILFTRESFSIILNFVSTLQRSPNRSFAFALMIG